MKKIMFSDKYGLTQAVLDGRKTMTRRIATYEDLKEPHIGWLIEGKDKGKRILCNEVLAVAESSYAKDEVVAIAQAYKDLDYSFGGYATNPSHTCGIREGHAEQQKGWNNKMFVSAKFMPHHIQITDIKVERLYDISNEDCLKEGITTITEGKREVGNAWGWDVKADALKRESFFYPRTAFAALIDKISGKGTWFRNPWVFAYEFELIT